MTQKMILKAASFVSLSLLVGCTVEHTYDINVRVHDGQRPVAGAEIRINDEKVGETDTDGRLKTRFKTPSLDALKVTALDSSLDQIRAPQVATVDLPWSFGVSRDLAVELVLPVLDAHRGEPETEATDSLTRDSQHHLGWDEFAETDVDADIAEPITVPLPDAHSLEGRFESWLASTLMPSVTGASGISFVLDAHASPAVAKTATPTPAPTENRVELSVSAATPKANPTATELSDDDTDNKNGASLPVLDGLSVQVFSEGKALAGAQVFMGRYSSRTVTFLGETDAGGTLATALKKEQLGEILLARHSCCPPLSRPVTAFNAQNSVRIDLAPGKAQDVYLVNFAYGFPRGVENAQLQGKNGQADVSNGVGFMAAPTLQLSPSFRVTSQATVPQTLTRGLTPDVAGSKPILLFAGTVKPILPAVGLVEFFPEEAQGVPEVRRFKRDFFARFVQSAGFRPMIANEVTKKAKAAKLTVPLLAKKGWQHATLAPELDALIVLTAQVSPRPALHVKIVDRQAQALAQHTFELSAKTSPEELSRHAFEKVLATFPFEGSVLNSDGDLLTLNFGLKSGRGLAKGQTVTLFGPNQDDPLVSPTAPIAFGEIVDIEDSSCRVKVTKRLVENAVLSAGTRAVRGETGLK